MQTMMAPPPTAAAPGGRKRWGPGRRGRILLGSVAAAGLLAVSAMVAGSVSFDRRLSDEVEDLFAASSGVQPPVITEAALAGLPEPVQRWLRYSRVAGTERPVSIRLKQEGSFQLREGWPRMPFSAEQYITTDPPGFIWATSIRMIPLVSITGRDRYTDGEGDMDMRLLSLIPVVRTRGGGLNQGAMLRYLGETAWYPAAAVSPYITWEPIDANSARATMSYGGVTASATFVVDDAGRLIEVKAERFNDATGGMEDWSARTIAYAEPDGRPLLTEVESVWHYATGDYVPIRLRITKIEYNQPRRY